MLVMVLLKTVTVCYESKMLIITGIVGLVFTISVARSFEACGCRREQAIAWLSCLCTLIGFELAISLLQRRLAHCVLITNFYCDKYGSCWHARNCAWMS